jgi:Zn-finger nucleic acid-binding protein
MTKLEVRLACPVCLGVTMQKSPIEGSAAFTLDHCTRCGGAWFDAGEVGRLRMASPDDLWRHVAQRDAVHAMQCHSCNTLLQRDRDECAACGWHVTLDCPECDQPMESGSHHGMTLDACSRCKGVWFDHHELAAVWNAEFHAALQRHDRVGVVHVGGGVLEALAWDPFTTYYVASAAGHVLSGAASAAPAMAEAASEAAASLFETIVEIIGGIFG